MNDNIKYWFKAKKYGYGLSSPATWEGWLVIIIYFLLLIGGIIYLSAMSKTILFVYLAIITITLVLISFAKGEKLAWRWGRQNRDI